MGTSSSVFIMQMFWFCSRLIVNAVVVVTPHNLSLWHWHCPVACSTTHCGNVQCCTCG